MQPLNGFSCASAGDALVAVARLNSLVVDYIARLKTPDIHLNVTIFNQLPGEPLSLKERDVFDWRQFISRRSLELTATSTDMAAFARDCAWEGPPFRWDEERRHQIRCELDAAFFHLYGLPRADVDYIMDTFPIVRRNDEQKYGDYRTKHLILEIYDDLQRAIDTGKPFVSRLDPPPGDPRAAHRI